MDIFSSLDTGIAVFVERLNDEYNVETFESCEGGVGHSYPEPTVAFHGGNSEGFRVLAAALQIGLPVAELRRVWRVEDGEPVGPRWQMTFSRKCSAREIARRHGFAELSREEQQRSIENEVTFVRKPEAADDYS